MDRQKIISDLLDLARELNDKEISINKFFNTCDIKIFTHAIDKCAKVAIEVSGVKFCTPESDMFYNRFFDYALLGGDKEEVLDDVMKLCK